MAIHDKVALNRKCMYMYLAGDIGGTKTVLMLFDPQDNTTQRAETAFPSAAYPSLESIVQEFLHGTGATIERACFGVAGPVVNGRAQITNLPWVMDERGLALTLGIGSVRLINDLEALAWAVPYLADGDKHVINAGEAEHGGAIAVIAPGTGLGTAYMVWDGQRYRASPAEGGHVDFAPTNERELELLRFLWGRYPNVSYEWLCSGIGLPNIYAFLKHSGYAQEPTWLAAQIAAAPDPTPVIVNAAMSNAANCTLCTMTVELFVDVLASAAGNLALNVLATGGVFLGGGIPPRILPMLATERFVKQFCNKDRTAALLGRLPINVVLNARSALFGAARAAMID